MESSFFSGQLAGKKRTIQKQQKAEKGNGRKERIKDKQQEENEKRKGKTEKRADKNEIEKGKWVIFCCLCIVTNRMCS